MTETKDVRIERTFDAPIELIWAMWTQPAHFAAWYGPAGAEVPRADLDVRVGGRRYVAMEMATPDGPMRMDFVGEYLEVNPPTRLVYTEAMADVDGNPLAPERSGIPPGMPATTTVVVELTDLGGRTSMVMTHIGVPADSPGAQGWTMAFDALEARVDGLRA